MEETMSTHPISPPRAPAPPRRSRTGARHGTRTGVACVACQQKKQKCDGRSPTCTNCIKADRACVIEDPVTKRQHPRHYMQTLEERVAFLEGILQDVRPELAIDHLSTNASKTVGGGGTRAGVELQSEQQTGDGLESLTTASPTASNQSDDLISTGIGLLCLTDGEPRYFGSSSAFSFSKVISSTLRRVRSQAPGVTMSGVVDTSIQSGPTPVPAPLPDRSTGRFLAKAYFENIHPQFPFLHEPTFLCWESQVMDAMEWGVLADPVQLFFVYMVYAVGAVIVPIRSPSRPEDFYVAAQNLLDEVLRLETSVSIQAILCCAMYSIRASIGVSVWSLSGIALRQCIELGLHRHIPWMKVEADALKTEMRRRVFWCAYNLDRAAAMTLGRPLGIMDHDIDVQYPLDLNDEDITADGLLREPRRSNFEPSTTLSGAIHTIRLRRIWGRIQECIYPTTPFGVSANHETAIIQQLKGDLTEWLSTIPDRPPSTSATSSAFATPEWFSLAYHHSILLLHRRRLVAGSRAPNDHPQSSASVYLECANSAQTICQLYRQLYFSQPICYTWGTLHILFLAGLTFLHCLWTSAETRAALRRDVITNTCTSCTIVLVVMTERWAAARPYRDTFEILTNETQSMLVEAGTLSNGPPMLPILSSTGHEQLQGLLSGIAEVGMCKSVEDLLNDMIQ